MKDKPTEAWKQSEIKRLADIIDKAFIFYHVIQIK